MMIAKGESQDRAGCTVSVLLMKRGEEPGKWEAPSEVFFACTKEAGNPGDGGVALISLVTVSHTPTVLVSM